VHVTPVQQLSQKSCVLHIFIILFSTPLFLILLKISFINIATINQSVFSTVTHEKKVNNLGLFSLQTIRAWYQKYTYHTFQDKKISSSF